MEITAFYAKTKKKLTISMALNLELNERKKNVSKDKGNFYIIGK